MYAGTNPSSSYDATANCSKSPGTQQPTSTTQQPSSSPAANKTESLLVGRQTTDATASNTLSCHAMVAPSGDLTTDLKLSWQCCCWHFACSVIMLICLGSLQTHCI
jgi:hypothetical protein